MGLRIFMTVAEVSGDKHAAQLVRSLKQLDSALIIEGVGGPEMAEAGATIHRDTVSSAAMGWRGALRAVELYGLLRWTKKHFEKNRPDLLIGVDSPSMNFHFAKTAHQLGIPVLQYVAPQLWAWQEWRIKKVRQWIDRLACILPFEEEYFRIQGVDAKFVGHPLFDELAVERSNHHPEQPRTGPTIGLLAGSRKSEADANFPHQLEVARMILRQFPQARFLVPTTAATEPIVQECLDKAHGWLSVGVLKHAPDAFDEMVPQCDLCITVSGTATLHVALHDVPMIVVYRGNPVLWHTLGRWIVRTRTYALVNLLYGSHEHIVPEFVPWYGSNEPVAACAIDMLKNPQKLEEQRARLQKLVQSLDKPGASMNVARMAMEMMNAADAKDA